MLRFLGAFTAALVLVSCDWRSDTPFVHPPSASAAQAAELPAWEYRCEELHGGADHITLQANEFGKARWEMMSVSGSDSWRVCFKRLKL
jgi:hypothetical protein